MHPNRAVRAPSGRSGNGALAVHQWKLRPSHGQPGLEVRRRARAHSTAQIDEERWVPLVRETDVFLVACGDALYLCHWTLGIVDFSICPHLAPEGMPGNSMAEAEQWAAGISGPAYAIDDETAIKKVRNPPRGTRHVADGGRTGRTARGLSSRARKKRPIYLRF